MPQQPSPPLPQRRPTHPFVYLLLGLVLVGFATLVIARVFWFETFRFPSTSMHPTLTQGTIMLSDKRGFGGEDGAARIGVGDLVVFEYPRDPGQLFVKRIVGMPGNRIEYRDGVLIRNGEPVATKQAGEDAEYVYWHETLGANDYVIARRKEARLRQDGEWIVPDGHYFASGDNRDNSEDSRYWGYVGADALRGRIVYVF